MIFWSIIYFIDTILFIVTSLTVAYMAIFAIASLFNKHSNVPTAKRQNRFVVIIPSYKKDEVIEQTVKAILGQSYPQRLFDVTVVSDHQKEVTNFKLAQYPITLLTPDFKHSTKARSLQLAINNLPQFKIYDLVVILDADNIVLPEFLEEMNDAYEASGTKAIQAHRVSRNRDTALSNLDSIFEEINNSIFRRGHIVLGLSSSIVGSGMAFDFNWFKNNITKAHQAWEDKELEALLVRQHIFIDFFDHILVFDEKTRGAKEFKKQRGRWASTQFHSIITNIRFLPIAIFRKQYDLTDKIIQWMLVPRTILVTLIAFMSIILPFIYMSLAIKWWLLSIIIGYVFAIATPNYLVDKDWNKSFLKSPFIMLSSLLNMIIVMRRKNRFINKNK